MVYHKVLDHIYSINDNQTTNNLTKQQKNINHTQISISMIITWWATLVINMVPLLSESI